ncbi:hypothetical protein N0V85_006292 [Neurospora sp. IMI 360204]|nr:hypothetical protein N0V85_006292 [Neurospora sp. IMI 360204]
MLLIRDYSQQQIQGSYMDLSDTTTASTTTGITSPNSRHSMSAYPAQQQQQQQATELSQHGLSDASACLGTVETNTLFNNNAGASHPQHQQTLSDFVVWTSAPSSSLTSASSPFVSHPQAEPRWHQYSVSAEPMLDEPRLMSSSLSLDNMSEGGLSTMPSSPSSINPFHNGGGGATGHHSLVCDGLPSPTHSSVSLQHHQQQYPSVMLNGGGGVPFDNLGGNNFSHHPSSSPSSGTVGGGGGGGDILFRGPISHRTVFDYPPSGPITHFDHETNAALKAEGPLSVSPGSLHVWLNNNHHQQQHKTPTPHPSVSPESSPIGANNTFFQHGNQMPLPIDFGNNAVQFGGSGHINTSQLHPHYAQQVAASNRNTQRKSLPHSPPHRGMGSGGVRPPSPRYNPAVMTTRDLQLPSHPNSPSMSMAWAHHQGQGQGLPHHHPLMIKPNTIPSHHHQHQHQHPHPSLASMSHPNSRRNQQPFHHGAAYPYHNPNNNNKRRGGQGHHHHHQDNNATVDHLKRARADQDALLVLLRKQGKSYKQIRQQGRFTEAESTLRGRYRTLTKSREQRVRKPEWTDKDLRLLEQAVRTLAKGPLSVTYSNASKTSSSSPVSSSSSTTPGPAAGEALMSITSLVSTSRASQGSSKSSTSTSSTSTQAQPQSSAAQPKPKGIPTTTTKIPWKQVSHYIFSRGGSYQFGNATVRKRWEELMRDQLSRGKDLQRPFWEQRSKRSPYHSLSLSQAASSSSSGFAASRAGAGAGQQVQRRQSQAQAQAQAQTQADAELEREATAAAAAAAKVKTEREEEKDSSTSNEDGNLAYSMSDWLDMSALGDDADENHDDNGGSNNGTDGDGDYDLSDASDSEEEEEEEGGDADSDDDYMEE